MVCKRDITICPWIGVVCNSHVTLGVMVRKRDMQPVCSSFNDVHVPCYMIPMCYFVPSSRQAYICAEVIAAGFIVIQCLPDIDSWSIHRTIISLIVSTSVTFIGSVDPVWLIAGLWISDFVEVSCSAKVMIGITRLMYLGPNDF